MTTDTTPTPDDGLTEEIVTSCRFDLLKALTESDRAPYAEQTLRDILSTAEGWEEFRRGCVFNCRNPETNLTSLRLTIALYNNAHGDVLPLPPNA